MEKVKELIGIYHEQQQGALCAQHALNNLLQSAVFTADDLGVIARELDQEEIDVLPEASRLSENVDDTGFFNIQVLQRALTPFELELVPYASQEPIAQQARNNPQSIQAYICNLGAHWFTIRRFAEFYFDLNSIYYVPVLLSDAHVLKYLHMVQKNGYSVFVVKGRLESCLADRQLQHNPHVLLEYQEKTKDMPKLIMDGKIIGTSKDTMKNGNLVVTLPRHLSERYRKNPDDPEIQKLIMESLPEDIRKTVVGFTPINPKSGEQTFTNVDDDYDDIDEIVSIGCGHPNCRNCRDRQLLPVNSLQEQFFDDNQMDKSKRPPPGTPVMVRETTEILVARPNPNNPNALSQQSNKTREVVIIRRRQTISTAVDDPMSPITDERDLHMHPTEDMLLREALARSLLDRGPPDDIEDPVLREQMKKEYQESFDELYAKNLFLRDAEALKLQKMRRVMPSSPSTSTVTNMPSLPPSESPSKLTDIPAPPLSPTSNSPLLSPMEKPAAPSMTTTLPTTTILDSLQSIATDSTPSTTPIPEPTVTAHVSPPKLTPQNSVEAPTIDELRQRRLQNLGFRDRSIISVQSNFDD